MSGKQEDLQSHARERALSGTSVSVLQTGLVAAAVTAALYLLLMPRLDAAGLVSRLFAHGWVPKAVVLLSAWSAVILLFKLLALWQQRRALGRDVLPLDACAEIRADNVEGLRQQLEAMPRTTRRSLVYRRVSRGLEFFQARGRSRDVASELALQSELDAVVVDSSYSMVKAFLWAIPMLGFVGTVLGIGDAVGSFSDSVAAATTSLAPEQQVANLRSSLGGVTSGLGLAFDTTLIALVFSILLMLPMNWLQKSEDDLLTEVSDYSNEHLLMRIEDGGNGAAVAASPTATVQSAATVAPARAADQRLLREQSEQLAALVGDALGSVVDRQERSFLDLAGALRGIGERSEERAERSEKAWERLANLLGERQQALEQVVAELRRSLADRTDPAATATTAGQPPRDDSSERTEQLAKQVGDALGSVVERQEQSFAVVEEALRGIGGQAEERAERSELAWERLANLLGERQRSLEQVVSELRQSLAERAVTPSASTIRSSGTPGTDADDAGGTGELLRSILDASLAAQQEARQELAAQAESQRLALEAALSSAGDQLEKAARSCAEFQVQIRHEHAEGAEALRAQWDEAIRLAGKRLEQATAAALGVQSELAERLSEFSRSLGETVREASQERGATLETMRAELDRRTDVLVELVESLRDNRISASTESSPAAAPAATPSGGDGKHLVRELSGNLEKILVRFGEQVQSSMDRRMQQFEKISPEVAAALSRVAEAAASLESSQARGAEQVGDAMTALSKNVGRDLPRLIQSQVEAIGQGVEQMREITELQKMQVEELREAAGSQPFRTYLSVLARDLSRLGDVLEQFAPKTARNRYWFGRGSKALERPVREQEGEA